MTRVTVGRTVDARSEEEYIHIDVGASHLNPDEARTLVERVEEQLALLDGGEVVPDTPPTDEMTASPEHHTRQGEGGDRDGEEGSDDREGSEDTCPDCGEEFASARGVAVHRGKAHGDERDDAGGGGDDIGQDEDVDGSEGFDRAQPQPDLPFACPVVDCEKRFADREDCRTHRDNAHTEVEVMLGYRERAREKLPDSISIVDVEHAVAANTTAGEVGDALGVEKRHAREWTNMLQLTDALREHSEIQATHMIEDLHDELGVDEPVPELPATDGGESA